MIIIFFFELFIDDEDTSVTDGGSVPVVDKGESASASAMAETYSPVIDKTDVFAIASSSGTCTYMYTSNSFCVY